MLKRLLSSLLLFSLLSTVPLSAHDPLSESEYQANSKNKKESPLGAASYHSANSAISSSMVAWGLGLATVITILALVINGSSAHGHGSSS